MIAKFSNATRLVSLSPFIILWGETTRGFFWGVRDIVFALCVKIWGINLTSTHAHTHTPHPWFTIANRDNMQYFSKVDCSATTSTTESEFVPGFCVYLFCLVFILFGAGWGRGNISGFRPDHLDRPRPIIFSEVSVLFVCVLSRMT